jgi:(1->4)-alpha-D-glucan 1-alpha-D-glucosylmutase
MNLPLRAKDEVRPEPDSEWMFYQALLGAWPVALDIADAVALKGLAERMTAFMVKAAREAKLHTTWTQPDERYERALASFVKQALDPHRSRAFLVDFDVTAQPFVRAGVVNSLTQLVLKLFAPGIPDIYQGTETWDLALVDPDNRRSVNFDRNADLLKAESSSRALLDGWFTGGIKLQVLRAGLRLRRSLEHSTEDGEYVPLELRGPLQDHVVAFARRTKMQTVVVVGTRWSLSLLQDEAPRVAAERWAGTQMRLPAASCAFTDILTGRQYAHADGALAIADVLRDLPVAVLSSRANQPG